MRPCDECGGSGNAPAGRRGGQPVFKLCGRCVDMPWLPVDSIGFASGEDHVHSERCHPLERTGRFKPDPDSVRPYCSIHESMRGVYPDGPTPIGEREGTSCEASLLESEFGWGFASNKDCNWVWVAPPQRLEEAQ